jgi:hypothetical protein
MGLFSTKKVAQIEQKAKVSAPKARKTIQQTIPYVRVYEDLNTAGGIIESDEGMYTKSYFVPDANYSSAGEEKQEEQLAAYEKILASFNDTSHFEITINNRNVDKNSFNQSIMMKRQEDGFDELRKENNDIIIGAIHAGKNNMKPEIYLTASVPAANIREAIAKFTSLEKDLNSKFSKINDTGIETIDIAQRLEIFHDIYNLGNEGDFLREKIINGQKGKAFDLKTVCKQGVTTKDIIGPSGFEFFSDYMMLGKNYARALYLKGIPGSISSTLLEDISSVSANMLLSVHYNSMSKDKAAAFAAAQVTTIGGDVIKAQRKLSESGVINPDLISPKLQTAQKDAGEMLDDITNHNMSLLKITLVVVVFARNMEDLDLYTEQIKTKGRENICQIDILRFQQEQGLTTALPLAKNIIKVHKIMTSYTASAIQPFASKELLQPGGLYYGVNSQTNNLIIVNRLTRHNQSAVTLGIPGGGKSFIAKNEMQQIILTQPKSQIFVVDPEREYVAQCKLMHGDVIKISSGANNVNHINPLDLDITPDPDGERAPLQEKVDFIIGLVLRMMGRDAILTGSDKNVIDQVVTEMYAPYLEYLQEHNLYFCAEQCPTLIDFCQMLRSRKEMNAKEIANQIQIYCTGSFNTFAYKTNINTENSKMVVYDISSIGENLKELGMYICLTDVWNRMIANKGRGFRTWLYLDEFYLILKEKASAEYLQMIWKRARKWGGCPTGITQNVEDLFATNEGTTIIETSDMITMLKQAPNNRAQLAAMLNISEEQQEFISNVNQGEGLLYLGGTLIPFKNSFPTNTKLYKIMSTKPDDAENVAATMRI